MSTHMTRQTDNSPEQVHTKPTIKPRVDIYENEDEILLMADLPGVQKENLTIEVNQDTLTFEGKRVPTEETATKDFWSLHFRRSFSLGQPVDLDNVSADLQQGILTLRLPKAPELKTRQIAIKSA